jgi:hypothetical protein
MRARTHALVHPHARVGEEQAQALAAAAAAYVEAPARGHRVDGVDDEVDEDFAQLRRVAARVERVVALDRHVVAQAARARVVLPARARDLDGVAQKSRHGDLRATLAR